MNSLLIGGEERLDDLLPRSLKVSHVLTSEINTCQFAVYGDKPSEYEEILITEDAETRFAGTVSNIEELPRVGDIYTWRVSCVDYTRQLDRLVVIEEYEAKTPDYIIKDIIDKYCMGFTYANVKSGAPTIELIRFNEKYPSECFKILAEYVGWEWDVDFDKDVHWFYNFSETAPVKIEDGVAFSDFKHTVDTKTLKNSIRVRGGTYLSDAQTISWKADGEQRYWPLPFKPSENSLEVGGATVTLGIENVDDESTKDYLLNYNEKYIRAGSATGTPANGTVFDLTCKQPLDVITVIDDTDSQIAIAALEGGDGIYEMPITDDSLTTIEAAEALAQATLRDRANPKVSASFITEIIGWEPGQLVEIELADRNINNTFLIQKVTVLLEDGNWKYRVECGSRLKGIADFLKALVSRQQRKVDDTELLHKFTYALEKYAASDELTLTPRTPPWYCGEADAICGFAECSGFFQYVAADGIGIKTGYEGR